MITARYSEVFLRMSPFTRSPPHTGEKLTNQTQNFLILVQKLCKTEVFSTKDQTNVSTDKKLDSAEVTKRIFRKSRVKNSQKNTSVWATHYTCTNMCFAVHKVQITCYDDTSLASGIRPTKVKEIQKFERKWLCTVHRDPSCQVVRFQT